MLGEKRIDISTTFNISNHVVWAEKPLSDLGISHSKPTREYKEKQKVIEIKKQWEKEKGEQKEEKDTVSSERRMLSETNTNIIFWFLLVKGSI